MKKFDFAIGNPPYQEVQAGENENYAPPIYHKFLDAAFSVAERVEMIHPARFLFNAGSTPKAWNEKMLNDPHFKILFHESDSNKVFFGTDIKGGIAISYHDNEKDFGAIEAFTAFPELNAVVKKVKYKGFEPFSRIVYSAYSYHFSDLLHQEHPEIRYKELDGKNIGVLSKGHDYDLKSNVLEKLPQIFLKNKPGKDYISIVGRVNNDRAYRFVLRKYIEPFENLDSYKLFISKANGTGKFGEIITVPFLGTPGTGSTETFLSIGNFESEDEAMNVLKYVQTKLFRALLGIMKVTQDLTPGKMDFIPLQDFTKDSDIDWSKSVADIDRQLYAKYSLSEEEINFIETHVQEMK